MQAKKDRSSPLLSGFQGDAQFTHADRRSFETSRDFERVQMDLSWKCRGNAVNNRRREGYQAA